MSDESKPVTGAVPSRDPANDGTMLGTLRQVMKKMMQGVDDMLPAQVIAYDRQSNRATVKPLVKVVATNGQSVSRAQIASVPVFQIGGGGFLLNFNLKAGDLGWIKASDRDTSLFLQGYSEQQPNTNRMHSFEDGLFFPHVMTGYTIDGEDADNAVLQSLDGTVRVAIWPDRVKITAPRTVIESPIVEVEASDSVTVVSPVVTLDTPDARCTGNLTVDGNINTIGTVIGQTDVVANGKSLKAHTHGSGLPIAGLTGVNN